MVLRELVVYLISVLVTIDAPQRAAPPLGRVGLVVERVLTVREVRGSNPGLGRFRVRPLS